VAQGDWTPPRRDPADPLEVLVLTGFLGAGKTTLFNYLLSGLSGLRVAAVVNDFGAVEVDALSVAGRVDSTISLAGGCMCCEIDITEVDTALADLAAPEHALDLVVIEASGLAEPDVLARLVRRQPRDTIAYGGLVNVVDAVHFPETAQRHPQIERHLAISDLLVLTKTDLLDADKEKDIRTDLARRAPRTPLTTAVRGRLDMRLLFGGGERRSGSGAGDGAQSGVDESHEREEAHGHDEHGHGHSHLHDSYTSAVAAPERPLHPRRFLEEIGRLPAGVFRAKGTVVLAAEDGPWSYEMSKVGSMLDLRAKGPSGPGEVTQVVVIGVDLPTSTAACLDQAELGEGEQVRREDGFVLEPFLVAPEDAMDTEGWIFDDERSTPTTGAASMLYDPEDPDEADPANTP